MLTLFCTLCEVRPMVQASLVPFPGLLQTSNPGEGCERTFVNESLSFTFLVMVLMVFEYHCVPCSNSHLLLFIDSFP